MKFIIFGGKKLRGTIHVAGSKNAALPILAATLLTDERCTLSNVPNIRDVEMMLELIARLGRRVVRTEDHGVVIEAGSISRKTLDPKLVKSFRASFLLLGPLLSRFRNIRITEPGGCSIGNRPLDDHVHGFKRMGVNIERSRGIYTFSHRGLEAKIIVLIAPSVTATENIIMAASLAHGTTVLKNAASEPHVQDLCTFLNAMGARIEGVGTPTLTVKGVKALHGSRHSIIPDHNEAATFIIMGLATKSKITITGIRPDHLDVVLETLLDAGARFDMQKDSITLKSSGSLQAMKVQTRPYPGIPTDVQSLFGVLATQSNRTSLIHETIFDGRFGYIHELENMGANAVVCDPHRVLITGPTPLYGKEVRSLDLRGGITVVVAGLVAHGQTIIHGAELIDRGYERIEERLRGLGADIRREE